MKETNVHKVSIYDGISLTLISFTNPVYPIYPILLAHPPQGPQEEIVKN